MADGGRFARMPDGARLELRVTGESLSSRVPVLLHRPLGGSMRLWGPFAEELAKAFPVIAFDPRGVGASSDVPWLFDTGGMARDAVAVLDALGVPRAHVFGLSLGGMVASRMAADAPERVDRLVLASTLPNLGAARTRVLSKAWGFTRAFFQPGAKAEVALVDRILSDEFRRAEPSRLAEIERAVLEAPATRRNLAVLALAAARHDARASLAGLPVRTLILAGRLDPIVGSAAERELLHDLPNARLEILEGAGHDLSLEVPLTLAAKVREFLEER